MLLVDFRVGKEVVVVNASAKSMLDLVCPCQKFEHAGVELAPSQPRWVTK
jgi:hypothetical protein